MCKLKRYPLIGFADRLSDAIENSGMSKTKLAGKIGVDRKMLYYYCCGDHDIPASILGRICKELKVSADYLLFGK